MTNLNEVAAYVAANECVSKVSAERQLNLAFEFIKHEVSDGREITIAGFGKFTPARRGERAGRNPQTGESMTVAARNVVKFSPAKAFKDLLNV